MKAPITRLAVSAALAVAATGATAAAAAQPDAAAHGEATSSDHIGIDLPDEAADQAREASDRDSSDRDSSDRDATDRDDSGATAESSVETDASIDASGQRPADAGSGAPETTHGAEVSAVATADEPTGADKGAAVSATARGNGAAESEGVEGGPDDAVAP